jgi:hypothetical protein
VAGAFHEQPRHRAARIDRGLSQLELSDPANPPDILLMEWAIEAETLPLGGCDVGVPLEGGEMIAGRQPREEHRG